MKEKNIKTIIEMFNRSVINYPNNRCFTQFGKETQQYTYSEAKEKIVEIAGELIELGVNPGDNIGLTGKNSPNWGLAYLSILYAGGVVIPVDNALKLDKKIELFKAAECSIVFSDSNIDEKYTYISLTDQDANYILNMNSTAVDFPTRNENDSAAILFTSGTTGNEKGVILTNKNLVSDVYNAQEYMQLYPNDVFYALLPIHHSYCMSAVFLQGLSVGAEIVFAKSLAIKQILKELRDSKVTMFLGIPLLFNKIIEGIMKGIREKGIVVYGIIRGLMSLSGLIKKTTGKNPGKKLFNSILKKASLDTNRICICGGGPLPSKTFTLFNQLGIDFVQGYGLTETSPIICLNPIYAYKEHSVGKVIPNCDMKIIDKDSRGIGEIAVKGPMVFTEYYKNKEATNDVFTDDGYFLTGDMGYLDTDNYLILTGRKKSLIVTEGGKNVYPEEIEDKFQLFFEIDQVLVRGFKKGNGERIEILFYPDQTKLQENGKERTEAILNKCVELVNKDLLPFQRIERITILDEPLEITTTKKIKRHKIIN